MAQSDPRDGPADDLDVTRVEVTSDMMEAGAAELVCFDWLECDPRDAAKRVFLAMLERYCGER